MNIKFLWNGIKVDGKLYRAHYSDGKLLNWPAGTLTIYRKDYVGMPDVPGLMVENDSDSMTDYFEKDRIRIKPDNPHYKAVLAANQAAKSHYATMRGNIKIVSPPDYPKTRADDKDEADIRYIVPLIVGGVLGLLAIVIVGVLFN